MGPGPKYRGRPGTQRPGRGGHGKRGSAKYLGKRQRFDSARVAQKEEKFDYEVPGREPVSESEAPVEETDGSLSEDDEPKVAFVRPYVALMKSFAETETPKAKRRKLDLAQAQEEAAHDGDAGSLHEDGQEDAADRVDDGPDEEAEDAIAPDDTPDDDEQPDVSDPFETHVSSPDESVLARQLEALRNNDWTVKKVTSNSTKMVFTLPRTEPDAGPVVPTCASPSDLKLKQRLAETAMALRPTFDSTEQKFAPLLFQYYDILFCERTVQTAESLRRMACLHAVNHIFKTRDRVIKNNAKAAREQGSGELDMKDQGFTRPKVLFLLPTRNACARMVAMICSLCAPEQQENRKRFDESYTDREAKFTDDKPADFRDLFEGNDDDMFRVGLKFTRKTIKYFAQFYQSDIIFASPLGLRMAMGSEDDKKLDFDFLSSIELVVLDQADALLMQNWEHVEHIFEHLNLQPKESHGCDFSRVRSWYLDAHSKHFRQTVVLSAFNTPELSGLLRSLCHNRAGAVRVQPAYAGVIGQLGVRAKQTFSRLESPTVAADPDARFAYFTKAIVPSLAKRGAHDSGGTLVFIPSYLDFVRVRNYFATTGAAVANVSFGTISEYADVPEASRARSHFVTGRHRVLLYTERAHHFRRYQLKGVQRVIMYGLPENPLFYKEIAGDYLARSEHDSTLEPGQGTVRVMFSKYDLLKLERVVGSQRVGRMMRERSDTFVFEEE